MSDTDLWRELHEAYVWKVNAAVGEDRMDLVWQLADEYTDRALALITATESPDCGRSGCVICTTPTVTPAAPAHHSWRWQSRSRHVARRVPPDGGATQGSFEALRPGMPARTGSMRRAGLTPGHSDVPLSYDTR